LNDTIQSAAPIPSIAKHPVNRLVNTVKGGVGGAVVGGLTGAAIGAVTGGPVGAVAGGIGGAKVGGVAGAASGAIQDPKDDPDDKDD
jgi:uncharacterized membrane protein